MWMRRRAKMKTMFGARKEGAGFGDAAATAARRGGLFGRVSLVRWSRVSERFGVGLESQVLGDGARSCGFLRGVNSCVCGGMVF